MIARILLCVLAAATASAAPAASPTKPINGRVVVTTNYYSFTGYTPFEAWQAMAEARPWKTNQNFNATTEWAIKAQYGFGRWESGFRLDWYTVETKVNVTLPRWVPPPDVSPQMVKRWTNFFRALAFHENGHVTNAREATAELLREAGALGSFDSRQEMAGSARRMLDRVIEKYQQRDRVYDAQTQHGTLQGARL